MAQRLVTTRTKLSFALVTRYTERSPRLAGPAAVPLCHSRQTRSFKSTTVSNGLVSYTMQKLGDTLAENFDGAFTKLGSRQFKLDDCPDLIGKRCVKEVADIIKRDSDRLDILVNNSGRGIMSAQITSYGVDRHMAVNHMGHVVLTSHFLPLVQRAAEQGNIVRISYQSSNLHADAPKDTKFASLDEISQDAGPNGQYGRSKLAVLLYSHYFNRKVTQNGHPNVLINATHPGFASTKQSRRDILEPYPLGGHVMKYGVELIKKDQFEGAVPTVFCATKIEDSGQYICPPCLPEEGSDMSQSDVLADRLMELTRHVIAEKTRMDAVERGCSMDDIVVH